MQPTLFLVTGLPGAGKSTVARMLEEMTGATILNSDALRRELFPQSRAYSPAETQVVIRHQKQRAKAQIESGTSVILDALFTKERPRAYYRKLAQELGADFKLVLVTADEEKIKERIAKRLGEGADPSEADFDYYLSRKKVFEPPPDPDLVIDTSGTLEAVAGQLAAFAATS